MAWIKQASRGLFALSVAALGAVAAQADVLVVRAIGPSSAAFKPGAKLPDSAPLVLKQGDQVVLLDKAGTRTVRGPGRFTAASAASTPATTNVALAALTGSSGRRARVGAVRTYDTGAAARPANIWFVDAAKGGTVCYVDPAQVVLWRTDAAAAATSKVQAGARGVDLAWAPGQTSQPWPASLSIADGASYRVTPAAGGVAADVRFVGLGTAPTELPDMASTLIARGCQAQLDMLIATTGG